jgi:AraC-like DNA-binding protein
MTDTQLSTADRWTLAFYGGGAISALVGQVWAAIMHSPFPDYVPVWVRVLVVAPAVAVIEVGGVAMAARGDLRRQLGETALGYRLLSAAVALFAVLFNWFGHQDNIWLAFFFAGFSALAYGVWLLQSGDRRRDALRDTDKLAGTAPVYGIVQWLRAPAITRRAKAIALESGVGLYESLRLAQDERRRELRRKAISHAVSEIIRSSQKDPKRAQIAVTTYDMERLADEIEARTDYAGWADVIGQSLTPAGVKMKDVEEPETAAEQAEGEPLPEKPVSSPPSPSRHPLTRQAVVKVAEKNPDWKPAQIAAKVGMSESTVRRHLADHRAAKLAAEAAEAAAAADSGSSASTADGQTLLEVLTDITAGRREPLSFAQIGELFGEDETWAMEHIRPHIMHGGRLPLPVNA